VTLSIFISRVWIYRLNQKLSLIDGSKSITIEHAMEPNFPMVLSRWIKFFGIQCYVWRHASVVSWNSSDDRISKGWEGTMRRSIRILFVTPHDLHLSLTHREVNRSFPPGGGYEEPACHRENVTDSVTVLLLVTVTYHDRRCLVCIKMPRVTFLSKRKSEKKKRRVRNRYMPTYNTPSARLP